MPQTAYHIRATILKCGASDDPYRLDPDVKKLWEEVLESVHPDLFKTDPPDLDEWHRKCYDILAKLLPTTSRFVGFARHVCDGLGIKYPTPKEIDMGEYIENLKVPTPKGVDKRMHYVDIYDLAIEHIQRVWLNVTRFACGREDLVAIPGDEWDLDTGRNKSAKDQRLVFWDYA